MNVTFLSAISYRDPSKNNGDCILVDTGSELIVYDCGCEEHAQKVLDYMHRHNYLQAKVVLSHNDSDHFDGIPYLVERGAVSAVYTLLLFRYKNELLDRIGDRRITRDSLTRRIEEIYDNIFSLGGTVELRDIFSDTFVAPDVTIPGPDKEYALDAVAKRIDNREGDSIDKETIVNAVSTQLSVSFGYQKKLLLTGDSSFAAIEETIKSHNAIQLPHHGKLQQAESIFDAKGNGTIYYVSDNTGASNGGSDDLRRMYARGRIIHNTVDGDQSCVEKVFDEIRPTGSYYRWF